MGSESVIDKMISSFKDPEQLKAFCESQYKEIVKLNKQINALKEENDNLLKDLERERAKIAVMAQNSRESIDSSIFVNLDDIDHEIICKLQLAILRNRATKTELTLEEARKVEIYSKILGQDNIKSKKSSIAKQLNSEDLIKQLEISDNGTEAE
jgi:cell division septum initiation protein DivIVA